MFDPRTHRRLVFRLRPLGKPRQTQSDKWKKRPAVVRYREFADKLRELAEQYRFTVPEQGMEIVFHLPMPKSWSKKKKRAMLGQPFKAKPDADNLLKAFLDALCEEDSYVWHLSGLEKRWAEVGHIVVTVRRDAPLRSEQPRAPRSAA